MYLDKTLLSENFKVLQVFWSLWTIAIAALAPQGFILYKNIIKINRKKKSDNYEKKEKSAKLWVSLSAWWPEPETQNVISTTKYDGIFAKEKLSEVHVGVECQIQPWKFWINFEWYIDTLEHYGSLNKAM